MLLFVCGAASAQQTGSSVSLTESAKEFASRLKTRSPASVVVLPFSLEWQKPKGLTELAENLSNALSRDLADLGEGITVVPRSALDQLLEKNALPPAAVANAFEGQWAVKELATGSYIAGRVAMDGGRLTVTMTAYETQSGAKICDYQVLADVTPEIQKQAANRLSWQALVDGQTVYLAGTSGSTEPRCEVCPVAKMTQEAVRNRTAGMVLLWVIVGVDGHAHSIVVTHPLPSGLTESAVKAVMDWKFKPANGPDGATAPVRQLVETQFSFYSGRK